MSTLGAGLSVQFQAGRAQFLVCATDRFFVVIRESKDDGASFFKELAINAVEVCFQLNALPMTQAGPASCVAVTAVDNRQIVFAVFHRHIIGKHQSRRFRHAGDQTTHLTKPQLGAQLHKRQHRTRFLRLETFLPIVVRFRYFETCLRDQRQNALQHASGMVGAFCQHDLEIFQTLSFREDPALQIME